MSLFELSFGTKENYFLKFYSGKESIHPAMLFLRFKAENKSLKTIKICSVATIHTDVRVHTDVQVHTYSCARISTCWFIYSELGITFVISAKKNETKNQMSVLIALCHTNDLLILFIILLLNAIIFTY